MNPKKNNAKHSAAPQKKKDFVAQEAWGTTLRAPLHHALRVFVLGLFSHHLEEMFTAKNCSDHLGTMFQNDDADDDDVDPDPFLLVNV